MAWFRKKPSEDVKTVAEPSFPPTLELVEVHEWDNDGEAFTITNQVSEGYYVEFYTPEDLGCVGMAVDFSLVGGRGSRYCAGKLTNSYWDYRFITPYLINNIMSAALEYRRLKIDFKAEHHEPVRFIDNKCGEMALCAGKHGLGSIMPKHMYCEEFGEEIVMIVNDVVSVEAELRSPDFGPPARPQW